MKFIVYLNIFTILLLSSGCKKFLELDPPKDQLATTNVYLVNETAISALVSIYASMMDNTDISTSQIAYTTGLSADELTNYSNSQESQMLYLNALTASNPGYSGSLWNGAFNTIYRANAVIEGCESSSTLDADVKKQLMAEATFVRAYWNFYLVNLYGDIPIVTATDYYTNSKMVRSPKSKVYEQIVADLLYAKENLNAGYVEANSRSTGEDRIRPNKATAAALLSRVYLYQNKYAEAESESSYIIDQAEKYTLVGATDVFAKNSLETIWALTPTDPVYRNTVDGVDFILTDKPSALGRPTISPQLLNIFDSTDKRAERWIGVYKDNSDFPSTDYSFPFKYKVGYTTAVEEYAILFRVAEQFLIRSEARAYLNKLNLATADLDRIRERAGLELIQEANPNISKDDLITAILSERQRELFAEQGHRWLDLKRTGNIDKVMNTVTAQKGGKWKTNAQLWPIPQTEIINNPALSQNPGYN